MLINGPPRAGKDVAARELWRAKGYQREKFAAPLKASTAAFFNLTCDELEARKDEAMPELRGRSPREVDISKSEEWAKRFFGDDIFGWLCAQRVRRLATPTCISDCGFQVEVDAFAEHFEASDMLLLRVTREGRSFDGDSRDWVEPCRGMASAEVANDGSFGDFCARVSRVVSAWERDCAERAR